MSNVDAVGTKEVATGSFHPVTKRWLCDLRGPELIVLNHSKWSRLLALVSEHEIACRGLILRALQNLGLRACQLFEPKSIGRNEGHWRLRSDLFRDWIQLRSTPRIVAMKYLPTRYFGYNVEKRRLGHNADESR